MIIKYNTLDEISKKWFGVDRMIYDHTYPKEIFSSVIKPEFFKNLFVYKPNDFIHLANYDSASVELIIGVNIKINKAIVMAPYPQMVPEVLFTEKFLTYSRNFKNENIPDLMNFKSSYVTNMTDDEILYEIMGL